MKITRLLPLASLCGATTLLTPILTSCGVHYDMFIIDLTNPQWTTVDQKIGSMTAEDATREFFKDIKENKNILANEFLYHFAQPSNVDVEAIGTYSFGINKIDVENCRLSIMLEEKVEGTFVQSGQTVKTKTYYKIEMFNMPFEMKWTKEFSIIEASWYFFPAFAEDLELDGMKEDPQWSVNWNSTIWQKVGDQDPTETPRSLSGINFSSIDKDLETIQQQLANNYCTRKSYYYANVTKI